ncbi:hypothetical protein AgCh_008239 [Apium graveolens]
MRMLCDNTKSFHPLSHYGSARKARIDRIIFEKFHAPAINAASSELLEGKTNKSGAEFQEWDVTRSYVYILDRMSSFVNASNQHQDATPTYLETRANPAELRQRVSKVKKRKRARRGVRKPRRQSDKQKFPIRTERGVVSQPAVGTRFATTVAGGNSFSEPVSKSIAQGGGQYKTTFHNQFRSPLPDHKSCGEKHPRGQRQTQKFFNIAQAKQLLRKDSKAYLAYVAGTKREAPIIPMRKNNHTYGSRNFLGINQFYERFVRDFAKISGPLIRPTCKTEKVVWNEKCEESFQELKRSLVSALVLALPDGKGDFVIYSDASHKGL